MSYQLSYRNKLTLINFVLINRLLNDFFTLIEPELMKMKKGCLVVLEPITVKLHKSGKTVS